MSQSSVKIQIVRLKDVREGWVGVQYSRRVRYLVPESPISSDLQHGLEATLLSLLAILTSVSLLSSIT